MNKLFIGIFILFFSWSSFSELPEFQSPQILARANVRDSYNLPPLSYITNTSPSINNRGDIAFKVEAISGENSQGFWFKTNKDENGKIHFVAPNERYLTDPVINNLGKLVFNQYDEGISDGLFQLDVDSLKIDQIINGEDQDIIYYTYPVSDQLNHIYFRATTENNERILYQYDSSLGPILYEGQMVNELKTSYIFRPAVNDNGLIAVKVRFGEKGDWDESRPDGILILENGKLKGAIYDHDKDFKSPFYAFSNSISISTAGHVAFSAKLEDGKMGIFVHKDGNVKTYALTGNDHIKEIETFRVIVNASGNVLFRAIDEDGRRGLYLADEKSVKRIIGEGDSIESDVGTVNILNNQFYPGFGGEVDLNDLNQIVFNCTLIKEGDKNIDLGNAIYLINPKN